ncbi:FAD-dependent monooxygenase [Micromonospora zhanjiangensis]|uniref:FAD-dependent monooxygenase n=1 Tax=Micromonospora zhanjiangensis TaxID=1522057 RepID=UPI003670555D
MPVGIVGAGPAGLVIAHMLHREDIPFVLLERSPAEAVGQHAKAGMIEHRTVELLRRESIADTILSFTIQNGRCEFRTPADSVVLDYGALTGGRTHYVYPQFALVDKLFRELKRRDVDIRCGHSVVRVREEPDEVLLSGLAADGAPFEVTCEVVVGCEGARSAVAAAMPAPTVSEQRLPVRWLAVMAAAAPLTDHTIYAAHPRGFAGHLRRAPTSTRYYLEAAATETVADWPQERIRSELSTRLMVGDRLADVPFSDVGFVDLRARIIEPMQHGRLYLAGDAAHVIPPAGGKGMNLAIQDAVELARGLIDRFGRANDGTRLVGYSAGRLPAIWRAQAFSNWHLNVIMLAKPPSDPARSEPSADVGAFRSILRQGWVSALQNDPILARWFAHSYAGADPV